MRSVGGLPMFVEQALASWELWWGPIADRARLARDVYARLQGGLGDVGSTSDI